MKKLLYCAVLLLVSPASATISQVQSQHNWSGSGTTCAVAFPSNPTGGNLIAVWTSWTTSGPNNVTATVKDTLNNGDTITHLFPNAVGPTVQSAASNPIAAQIFYAANINGGHPDTVTVTFSSAPSTSNCVIVEYSGADQSYPLDSVSEAISNSSAAGTALDSGTASPANAGLLLFGGGNTDGGTLGTITPPWTVVQSSGGSMTEQQIISGNGALQRATATSTSSGNWVMQMAVFRAASWTVATGSSSTRLHNVIYADQVPGIDIGDQVNHAYAALPLNGGHIIISGKTDGSCYSFSTPIVLNTAGKYVLLEYLGSGGLITNGASGVWSGCLNYTGIGAAITLDYATSATDSLSPIHGLKNIVLVNNFCGQTGCTSSATGVLIGSTNRGIQSATMEDVSVSGFSVGYQTQNFYSDPVNWFNPHFFGNTTGWAIGNVSTQAVYGGFFTGNATAISSFGTPANLTLGNYDSEMSFYGTTFVDNGSWDFDYGDGSTYGNNVCCASLGLYGVHLEQFMYGAGGTPPTAQRVLQGKVDFLMSGGVVEDDQGACGGGGQPACPDYWFNASGDKFTIENVEIQAHTNTPSVAVVEANTSTRIKVNGFIKSPLSLGCANIVAGSGLGKVTQEMSDGNTGNTACVWTYESPLGFGTASKVAGICQVGATSCAPVTFVPAFQHIPVCVATDQNGPNAVQSAPTASSVTFSGTTGDHLAYVCFGNPN